MSSDHLPDLTGLSYDPQTFRDLADTDLGQALWDFIRRSDNVLRMETATYLGCAAVEPLAPGLLQTFGAEIGQDRLKQMIGHMVRQVMRARGYELDLKDVRFTRESMFTTAAQYRDPAAVPSRTMSITPEQRRAWMEKTARTPFNVWLDAQVRDGDGVFDLERLYKVAKQYGIEVEYRHLNAGQQRMNIGIQLRKVVPKSVYEPA